MVCCKFDEPPRPKSISFHNLGRAIKTKVYKFTQSWANSKDIIRLAVNFIKRRDQRLQIFTISGEPPRPVEVCYQLGRTVNVACRNLGRAALDKSLIQV